MVLLMVVLKTILYAILGFSLISLFLRLFPVLFGIDVSKEIKAGNLAVSVMVLGVFIFTGFIIGFLVSVAV